MLRSVGLAGLVALALTGAGAAGGGERVARPRLELRATPAMAFSPVEVMVMGRLVGGEDVEEFYCPAFDWDWGDGGRSTRESDCPPFDEETAMARRFSLAHRYRAPGDYNVTLTLRRAGRTVAVASAPVRVLGPGGGGSGSELWTTRPAVSWPLPER
jgi:hypothetical protein